MKTFPLILAIASAGLFTMTSAPAQIIYPEDNGFEAPNLGTAERNDYAYGNADPSLVGYGWVFSYDTNVGIVNNPATPTLTDPTPEDNYGVHGATNGNSDGTTSSNGQAAIITDSSSTDDPTGNNFYQPLSLAVGSYTVSFDMEGGPYGYLPIEVGFSAADGTDPTSLGIYTPTGNAAFTPFTTTLSFDVTTAATYQLYFEATLGGNVGKEAFIDNVSLFRTAPEGTPSVPEPSTQSMILLALASVVFFARRRSQQMSL